MNALSANRAMTPLEWIMLLTLSLVWGGSYFFVALAVTTLPPLTIVMCRVGIASLALWAFMRFTRQIMPRDGRVWIGFFIMGLLNNAIPFSLIVWGQTQISSGQASILNATTPIFTVIVAHLFTRDERMTMRHVLGTGLGFAGVVVLMGESVFGGVGDSLMAQAALLGAAISYAFSAVFGRRFRGMGVAPMQMGSQQSPLTPVGQYPSALAPPPVQSMLNAAGIAPAAASWGAPWQPVCGGAFNKSRGPPLAEKWAAIPDDVDVLLTHGPPLGHGDRCRRQGTPRAGCLDLLEAVTFRVKPRYHCFGHIHEGYGVTTDGTTTFVNASSCTVRGQCTNLPLVIDVERPAAAPGDGPPVAIT